jgi:hypothetical protein
MSRFARNLVLTHKGEVRCNMLTGALVPRRGTVAGVPGPRRSADECDAGWFAPVATRRRSSLSLVALSYQLACHSVMPNSAVVTARSQCAECADQAGEQRVVRLRSGVARPISEVGERRNTCPRQAATVAPPWQPPIMMYAWLTGAAVISRRNLNSASVAIEAARENGGEQHRHGLPAPRKMNALTRGPAALRGPRATTGQCGTAATSRCHLAGPDRPPGIRAGLRRRRAPRMIVLRP